MTNFYNEFGFDPGLSIDQIQNELNKLEATWKRREITNPEKATTMLALIIQAREAFESESSKRRYDRLIDEASKESNSPNTDADNIEQFKRWVHEAENYYSNTEYDLAKSAIEKALQYYNPRDDDDSFYSLAAVVYNENRNYQVALDYINKAIIINPQNFMHYVNKGQIYERLAGEETHRQPVDTLSTQYYAESRKAWHIAEKRVESNGAQTDRAVVYGVLAHSYYYRNPKDKDKAEKYALRANELGGDRWNNADRVLSEIEKERKAEEARQEEERKERIYRQALSRTSSSDIFVIKAAIEELRSLNGWRDSDYQIDLICQKIYNDTIKLAESNDARKVKIAIERFNATKGYRDSEKQAETLTMWLRRANQKCQYCGGDFKGFIKKECVQCGRAKDYSFV
ncbi:hypothetical protein IJG04_00445 [Candidatus Saccharibacteria bacterium]|nr:hypothetical protein [Candidatus Saccharibacteria bacterium]